MPDKKDKQQLGYLDKFRHSFLWSLSGSVVYELVKTIHNFFLIQFISQHEYGVIGSVLSIAYLSVKVADIGTTHSLPPFFYLIQRSRYFFIKIFWRYFLLPQLPAIAITCVAATFFCHYKFLDSSFSWVLFFLPVLIVLETLRSFFRYFLHFAFKSPYVVSFEVGSFFCYVGIIWLGLLSGLLSKGLDLIVFAHLIDSFFIVAVFSYLIYRNYQQLPVAHEAIPKSLKMRIVKMRFFNYLLRLSREFFTNSFLTPVFAIKFGLQKIGLFFFAGSIATSVQSIIKAVIGHSGTALLANVIDKDISEKRHAFELLCRKLLSLMVPVVIFLCLHIRLIVRLSSSQQTPSTFVVSVLFLFATVLCIEFFFMLYEQFYVMEEATRHLFMIKLLQFVLLYLVVGLSPNTVASILTTFSGIVVVRLISFVLVVVNAYFHWGIRPRISVNKLLVLASLLFSVLSSLMLNKLFL